MNLLVIDDAGSTRKRLCDLLAEIDGARTLGCPALRHEVQRLCMDFAPDGVVIDVPLHTSEGFDLLSDIRALRRSSLIIALSNEANPEFERSSVAAGANHFLNKTTHFEHVVDLVRRWGSGT